MGGIYWHSHGWDCADCGASGMREINSLDADQATEHARITKEAADHARACPLTLLTEHEQAIHSRIGDLRGYGEYNEGDMGKDFPHPEDNDPNDHAFDHENEFAQGFGKLVPINPIDTEEEAAATAVDILAGVTQLLADDIERARKMWKDGPHENYRLPPK